MVQDLYTTYCLLSWAERRRLNQLTELSISIISHRQIQLVQSLLDDLQKCCSNIAIEVILTMNVEESLPFIASDYKFPVQIVHNDVPKGFGENHNAAFALATGNYFCVLNPDIRLNDDPFRALISCLQLNPLAAVVGPLVLSSDGKIEDSARRFPSPLKILCKAFGKCRGSDYIIKSDLLFPDWVGGMCMLFRCDAFKQLGGFDQRYFLYYEDVDLCARMRLRGYEVILCPDAKVVHDARRDSHRKWTFFKWHLSSMLRFFSSPVYWRWLLRRWLKIGLHDWLEDLHVVC